MKMGHQKIEFTEDTCIQVLKVTKLYFYITFQKQKIRYFVLLSKLKIKCNVYLHLYLANSCIISH